MVQQYDFADPVPKGYEWASPALKRLKRELGDVELMCPDLLNAFLRHPENPGYIQLTESSIIPKGLTTVAHAFGIRRGNAKLEIGIEIFHAPYAMTDSGKTHGNLIGHELAHVGDHVRSYGFSGDGKASYIPCGMHSHSRLFQLCTSTDKALEGPASLIAKLEKRIAAAEYAPEKYKSELFAATLEQYIENPTSVPACTSTYIENVFLPDMKLKAAGHFGRRAKLELDYLNPKNANTANQELSPALDTLLAGQNLKEEQNSYLQQNKSKAYDAVISHVESVIPRLEKASKFYDPVSGAFGVRR